MKIPQSFIKAQMYFQDNKVLLYKQIKRKGSLGTEVSSPKSEPECSFMMNFKIISDAQKAQEWGLQAGTDATASISRSLDIKEIEKGDYLFYGGKYYRVREIHPHDSFYKYILKAVTQWDRD